MEWNLLIFLNDQKKANVVAYDESLGKLDYILVGSIDQGTAFNTISSFCFKAKDGKTMGLNLDYFRGKNFDMQVDRRISAAPIDFNVGSKLWAIQNSHSAGKVIL